MSLAARSLKALRRQAAAFRRFVNTDTGAIGWRCPRARR